MPTNLDKQRRNLLILESIILLLELTNTKVKCIPLPLLKDIDIEKLSFMWITSYNNILMYMLVYFGFRFIAHYIDNKDSSNKVSIKDNVIRSRPKNIFDKLKSMFIDFLSLIVQTKTYDLLIPIVLFIVILYASFIESYYSISSKSVLLLVFLGFILILFFMGIIDYFKNKNIKYNYIKKDENIVKLRDKYKTKKVYLNNRNKSV